MGVIRPVVLEAVRNEIENSPHKIIYVQELADARGIEVKDLCNEFKYRYRFTVKEYASLFKLRYLVFLILQNGKPNGRKVYDYAVELGFRDDSGLHNFIRKNGGGRSFRDFEKHVLTYCREICKWKCKQEFKPNIKPEKK